MISPNSFHGFIPGSHLLITGAIHGDEPCGPLAINKIIDELQQGKLTLLQGSVTFIPVCNPEGYTQNKRLIDENLARIFDVYQDPKSYEQQCSTVIASYIDRCDALLDIHSGNADHSLFVFQDIENSDTTALTNSLGFELIVHGRPDMYPNDVAKDPSSYAHAQGKTAVVVECGQHQDPKAVAVAYQAMLNFLHHYGLIVTGLTQSQQKKHIKMKQLIYQPKDRIGTFTQDWKSGDKVSIGTLIGSYDDGESVLSSIDGYIILPKHYAQSGTEWFYLATDC